MGKVSEVEINGHRYRYAYENGATVYCGPVGSAPEISEDDFHRHMENSLTRETALMLEEAILDETKAPMEYEELKKLLPSKYEDVIEGIAADEKRHRQRLVEILDENPTIIEGDEE